MMGLELAENTLKIEQIGSTREATACALTLADLMRCLTERFSGRAFFVAWQMNGIVWGRWQDGQLALAAGGALNLQYIEELRVFNETAEIHLCRRDGKLQGRFINDTVGNPIKFVDSFSRLWGEKERVENGYITLVDKNRKLTMTVPCDDEGEGLWYGLVTRNYIGINETTYQAGYTDYRYVGITSAEGGK